MSDAREDREADFLGWQKAAMDFCEGVPQKQLEAAGSLRALVEAAKDAEYSIHCIWRDPVIRDRKPSNQPLLDLAESQRAIAVAFAPFQGGDDGA